MIYNDAEELVARLFNYQKNGDYVFRGISNRNQLYPTVIRIFLEKEGLWLGGPIRNISISGIHSKKLRDFELALLTEYGRYATQYLPTFLTSIDWVASAQHYGLATRLIDWTENPFCALYFSVFNQKDLRDNDKYEVIVCKKSENIMVENLPEFPCNNIPNNRPMSVNAYINSYRIFTDVISGKNMSVQYGCHDCNPPLKEFCDNYNESIKPEVDNNLHKLLFCKVYESNPRIIAQSGLFEIPRRLYSIDQCNNGKLECIESDIENASCEILEIDKRLRSELLTTLTNLNIKTPHLFPDLASICKYINKIQ